MLRACPCSDSLSELRCLCSVLCCGFRQSPPFPSLLQREMGSCNSKPQKDTVQAPPKDGQTGDELCTKPQPQPKPAQPKPVDPTPVCPVGEKPVKVDDVCVKDEHKHDCSTSVSSSSSSSSGCKPQPFVRPPLAELWHSSASPAAAGPVATPAADYHAVPLFPSAAGHNRKTDDAPFIVTINGTQYAPTDRSQLLVDFLHSSAVGLPGTKLACGQGGCGACTVNVVFSGSDPNNVRAVNSCMRPMGLLEGASVTTIEGLNSTYPPLPGTKAGAEAAKGCGGAAAGGCGGHGGDAKGGCGGGHSHGAGEKSHACSGQGACGGDKSKCSNHGVGHIHGAAKGHPQGENKSMMDSTSATAIIEAEHERTAAAKAKGAKSVGDTNADPRLVLATYNGTQCGVSSAVTQRGRMQDRVENNILSSLTSLSLSLFFLLLRF